LLLCEVWFPSFLGSFRLDSWDFQKIATKSAKKILQDDQTARMVLCKRRFVKKV
jgi:hypothetical protein